MLTTILTVWFVFYGFIALFAISFWLVRKKIVPMLPIWSKTLYLSYVSPEYRKRKQFERISWVDLSQPYDG